MGIPKIPTLPDIPEIPDVPSVTEGPHASYCQDMEKSLDEKINSLAKAKNATNNARQKLKDTANEFAGKPETTSSELNDAKNRIKDGIDDATPATGTIDDFLNECPMLAEKLPKMSTDALKDKFNKISLDGIKSAVDFSLFELPEFEIPDINFPDIKIELPAVKLPEIDLAGKLGSLNTSLEGLGVPSLMSGIDGIINCLDAACGSDVSGKVDLVNSMVDEMKITDDGLLDEAGLLAESGLTGGKLDSIIDIKDVISTSELDAMNKSEAVGNSVADSIKQTKEFSLNNTVKGKVTSAKSQVKNFFS